MTSSSVDLRDRLGERDYAVLADLERFRLLTTEHLRRMHFVDHSSPLAAARACTRSLRRLHDFNLVGTLERRVGGVRRGSASFVWQLTSAGDRLLRSIRAPTTRRRYLEPGGPFVNHTLAVADAAVDLIVASQRPGAFHLEELGIEPRNWRSYIGSGGDTRWLKPDLHVITSHRDSAGEYEEHAFLEIDLGTEHLPRIRAKCQVYAAYAASGAYQAEHGLFPAVVWLSADVARREALSAAVAATTGLPAEAMRVASPTAFVRDLARRA